MQVLSTARPPQVEKVVVEETISPFAQSPLMVAMSTLQVRQGPSRAPVLPCMQVLTTAPSPLPHRFVRDRATTRPSPPPPISPNLPRSPTISLQVRQGPSHDSPLVETCHKILPGSLVRVGAKEMLSFKEKLMTKPVTETRMHIELDGDQEPLGWVTGISRDEVETLKLASRGFPLMKTTKACVVRESNDREDH